MSPAWYARYSRCAGEAHERTIHGYGVGSLPTLYARCAGKAYERSIHGQELGSLPASEWLTSAPFMVII
jgi:hypothetical protein